MVSSSLFVGGRVKVVLPKMFVPSPADDPLSRRISRDGLSEPPQAGRKRMPKSERDSFYLLCRVV